MTRRTPRKDCNYVIYAMTSERGDTYIGLTRKSQPNVTKVVAERWRKHKSRARNENRLWALYIYLKSGDKSEPQLPVMTVSAPEALILAM